MKTYASDTFLNQDGTLNISCTAPMSIVCLGGSLTELGVRWVDIVREYFAKKFPHREVTIYNAGVGGTGSTFGAARFEAQVLSKNPDFVIIEFSVNDMKADETASKMHMENMVRQALKAEKVPCILFAHTPVAVDKDNENYSAFMRQVNWKGEIAAHYGIDTVNIYDTFYRHYEQEKTANPALTYREFLAPYYREAVNPLFGDFYDVHPKLEGYELYAEAFCTAFDERLPEILSRPKENTVFCTEGADYVNAVYHMFSHTSDRLTYEGNWDVWSIEHQYTNEDKNAYIYDKRYRYPFFDLGMRRAYRQKGATFSFKTTANVVALYYMAAKSGEIADVFADGVHVGEVSARMGAQQPFMSARVSLNNQENREVTVRFAIREPSEESYSYCFGDVIEIFKE